MTAIQATVVPPAAMLDRASTLACLVCVSTAVLPLATVLPNWVSTALLVLLVLAWLVLWRRWTMNRWLRTLLTLGMSALVMLEFGVGMGGGFGRDTAGALLAVMLLLKLLELTSVRDGRAVLCFSLFAIFAAFLQDHGPLILGMALLATLLVLATLARMAEIETPAQAPLRAITVRPRLLRIGKLAALSLPLALVGFFLFPRLANPLWSLPQNSDEARSGLSEEMSPGDISSLFLDDTPVMRVRFEGNTPPSSAMYWRGPVMASFDGRRWSRWPGLSNLDQPSVELLGTPLSYEIEQEPTERRYLFALDLPAAAGPNQRLSYERSLIADKPLIAVTRLSLQSHPQYLLDLSLNRTLKGWFRQLPDGFNPRTLALAQQWRAEGDDDEAIIRRALAWFNAEFTYTLNPILLGRDSVDDFLFNTKQGYCEHFSSSFAVLMRAAGIPARIATGYQGGSLNSLADYVVVRQSDAHAWTEVWLKDRGWVRIDPTSAVAPERIERGVGALGANARMQRGWGRTLFEAADWMRRGWNDLVLGFDATKQSQLLLPFGVKTADWPQLAIALISAAGIAMFITMFMLLRPGKDQRDALARAYAEFQRRLAKRGGRKAASEGPLAFAERVQPLFPADAAQIAALSMRYARQRYAPVAANPQVEHTLCADLRGFRLTPEERP